MPCQRTIDEAEETPNLNADDLLFHLHRPMFFALPESAMLDEKGIIFLTAWSFAV